MKITDDLVQYVGEGRSLAVPTPLKNLLDQKPVKITIDGREIEVPPATIKRDETGNIVRDKDGNPVPRYTTIYDAAAKLDIKIPILCHREHMSPAAVCRVCVVDLDPEGKYGKLAPACQRPVAAGMKVSTYAVSERVRESVNLLTELLMSDHPTPCKKHRESFDCELELLSEQLKVAAPRFPRRKEEKPRDDSSVVIAVDHNACILCDRCIRGCNEIRHNEVLGRMGKGYGSKIAFDIGLPMGQSSCVSCGECMISCPTGALTNRYQVRDAAEQREFEKTLRKENAEVVTASELARMPLFEGVSHPFLRFNEGAVRRRRYKPGAVICKEGEFGSTAFYLEKGKVNIFIQSSMNHVRSRAKGAGGLFGVMNRLTSFVNRSEDKREDESKAQYIHIDAPVSLKYDNPIATLSAGDIFGEMTCMSNYPRAATVTAAEDVVVLEMDRNVLFILQRNKKSKALLDERYRRNSIDNHLRSVPIFAMMTEDETRLKAMIDFLRDRVDLLRVPNGEPIFNQGDPADAMYLIRTGFVKISQRHMSAEHVLNYLGPGGVFGEIGLLTKLTSLQASNVPPGVRVASVSALDHVDLVKVSAEVFSELLTKFPEVRDHMIEIAKERLETNERLLREAESQQLSEFLSQGLFGAKSLLVLDLEKCTRCDECTKACSDAHDGVTRLIREGLRFDKYLVASSCRSCMDPYCMVGCPVGSIRRSGSREMIIEDWCIGCGKCAENCPYGNINMHASETKMVPSADDPSKKVAVVEQKATTCDLCREIDGQPSCVYACPHDAAHRMTGEDVLKSIMQSSN